MPKLSNFTSMSYLELHFNVPIQFGFWSLMSTENWYKIMILKTKKTFGKKDNKENQRFKPLILMGKKH